MYMCIYTHNFLVHTLYMTLCYVGTLSNKYMLSKFNWLYTSRILESEFGVHRVVLRHESSWLASVVSCCPASLCHGDYVIHTNWHL